MRWLNAVVLAVVLVVLLGCDDGSKHPVAPAPGSRASTGDGASSRDAGMTAPQPDASMAVVTPDAGAPSMDACDPGRVRAATQLECGGARSTLDCQGFRRTDLGGPTPSALRVLDVNGDGRDDVLGTADGVGFVRLAGSGGLEDGCAQELGFDGDADALRTLAFGDLDDDGLLDAVGADLTVQLGVAPGQLGPALEFDGEAANLSVLGAALLADLDREGGDEVLISARELQGDGVEVLVLLAFEDGALVERARFTGILSPGLRIAIDADGDGDMDVVSISGVGPTGQDSGLIVDALLFAGGMVDRLETSSFPQLAPGEAAMIARDFDRDGRPELILPALALDTDTSGLLVLKGAPGGGFIQVHLEPGRALGLFEGGLSADCGRRFLIATDTDVMTLLELGEDLRLSVVDTWTLEGSEGQLLASDFDGDGRVDLAGVHRSGDGLSVYRPDGCPR